MEDMIRRDIYDFIKDNDYGDIYLNYSFKMITTLKVGGDIALLYLPNSEDSLIEVLKKLIKEKVMYFIIGNGSNVLASDNYYDGVIISLKKIPNQFVIETLDNNMVSVSINSGCSSKKFSEYLLMHSISGAEAIGSIPASIGGIVSMNASCYDYLSSKYVKRVDVLIVNNNCIERKWLDVSELDFSYRYSKIIQEKLILLKVEFIFKKGNYQEIKEKINLINKKKKESQPIYMKSAGSTFKNTLEYNAWEVIDKLGLRGFRIGDACVSQAHTNFLVNLGNAKANDFIRLIKYIKEKALSTLNINLEVEWILLNF